MADLTWQSFLPRGGARHPEQAGCETEGGRPLIYTREMLRSDARRLFAGQELCVISNREPWVHLKEDGKIQAVSPAGGLVTAVEPLVRTCSGLWIAHGSGTADREVTPASGKIAVPPEVPEYLLKRIWLTPEEEAGHYYGFSNEALWPLCHNAFVRPIFDHEDWRQYLAVNQKFADAFADEYRGRAPVVLIQDYHFALLPRLIRHRMKTRRIRPVLSLFWHIPWPSPEIFGICPWKEELLRGLLEADLLGFHTEAYCGNFLDTVSRYLEARVDRDACTVTIHRHVCQVEPFSIGVEWPPRNDLPLEEFEAERERTLRENHLPPGTLVGLGVDRIDYTKGIVERLLAVEVLLDRHPELVGKLSFIQIGAPSRTNLLRYQALNREVRELAARINEKFRQRTALKQGAAGAPPIILRLTHHDSSQVFRYFRAGDFCFVSSLHDGMNLVAKEYVSARKDERGVLVLSEFTGAASEMSEALLVNPFDIEACAGALYEALMMSSEEKRWRMRRLRELVARKNAYAWAESLLTRVHEISEKRKTFTEGGLSSRQAA